ncbi:MAG: tRNA 2-thiocytidine biosynthesis protein TtcA [Tissierellia bacterium]|nr:tRNA 2-thiocytidine biosynthesis protein TtcA [Tissierellia bacterium]
MNKKQDELIQKSCNIITSSGEKKPLFRIERSLVKRYRKNIWNKFMKSIREYELIQDGDRIAVAISGGKDSLLMAKLFQELQGHGNFNFELEFIAMDPGYHPDIKELLVENCKYLNIPIHIYESGIFEVAERMAKDNPCYMCARMRRGALYGKTEELGCNKLALGHHFNDVIETILLNVLCSGNFKTMLPKLRAQNFDGIELIRPLYYVEEEYISRFIRYSGIFPLNCACMVAAKEIGTKRQEIKELIEQLKGSIDNVDMSIFRSAQNVSIDRVLGWERDGEKHSFLEFYDED